MEIPIKLDDTELAKEATAAAMSAASKLIKEAFDLTPYHADLHPVAKQLKNEVAAMLLQLDLKGPIQDMIAKHMPPMLAEIVRKRLLSLAREEFKKSMGDGSLLASLDKEEK